MSSTGEVKVCLTATSGGAQVYLAQTYRTDADRYEIQGFAVEKTIMPPDLLPDDSKDPMRAVLTVKTKTSDIIITYQEVNDIIPPGRFSLYDVFVPMPAHLAHDDPENPSESG